MACPENSGHELLQQTTADVCKCEPGYYAGTGAATCVACRAGTYTPPSSDPYPHFSVTDCTECGAGTFSAELAATSDATCEACPAGTYYGGSGANASSWCAACAPGTFSTATGATGPET